MPIAPSPFPVVEQLATTPPFPGLTDAPAEEEPFAPGAPGQPIVQSPQSSIAARTRRRTKKKRPGLWFALLCGSVLAGGLGWLYRNSGPDLEMTRIAYTVEDEELPRKLIENAFIQVPDEVRRSVLQYFEENPERIRSQIMETEFRGSSAGLEVQVLAGLESMLYRVPIDSDLRTWYDANFQDLQSPRVALLKKSLKSFFEDWDVAIRNQSSIDSDKLRFYRDSVGLTGAVGPLGYHVSAKVGNQLRPCVYEDDAALYFLLPRDTKKFQVVGSRTDNRPSSFPGEFEVIVKKGKARVPPKEVDSAESKPVETPEPSMDEAETPDSKMKNPDPSPPDE